MIFSGRQRSHNDAASTLLVETVDPHMLVVLVWIPVHRGAGRRLTSGGYNYVLFRGLKLEAQDLVIVWTQFGSSIGVAGQNVEMAVRSNGHVT